MSPVMGRTPGDGQLSPMDAPRASHAEIPLAHLEAGSVAPHRREHARCRVELDVSLGSDHNFYAGFVENLSVGGVFVATHALRAIGEDVEFTVHLPGGMGSVHGVGEVRWIREYSDRSNVPPGMGVRFVELQPGGIESIQQFLSSRDPLFFDDE